MCVSVHQSINQIKVYIVYRYAPALYTMPAAEMQCMKLNDKTVIADPSYIWGAPT